MKSTKGSAWKALNFSLNKKSVFLDEFGMTTPKSSMAENHSNELADYLIRIQVEGNRINLKALRGAAWRELKFTLSYQNSVTLNEWGMAR
ncbi:MAG: hypothetical protein N2747_05615 [Chitinophagaceae bacterium]|nr:hypothetical protein [Chitinophagaceae bacterium]